MRTTAASVEMRVRVERLEKVMATVRPVRALCRDNGRAPDLSACLCEAALRTWVEKRE